MQFIAIPLLAIRPNNLSIKNCKLFYEGAKRTTSSTQAKQFQTLPAILQPN